MVYSPLPRPAGPAEAQVLGFPRTGVLRGWRPGHSGPGDVADTEGFVGTVTSALRI